MESQRSCLKCGAVKPSATFDALEECPRCGAIFGRVEDSMRAASRNLGRDKKDADRDQLQGLAGALVIGAFALAAFLNYTTLPVVQETTSKVGCDRTQPSCILEKLTSWQSSQCERMVESTIQYRHEWKDSFGEGRFTSATWYEPPRTVILHGKVLEVENEFGARYRPLYFCVIRVSDGRPIKAGIPE